MKSTGAKVLSEKTLDKEEDVDFSDDGMVDSPRIPHLVLDSAKEDIKQEEGLRSSVNGAEGHQLLNAHLEFDHAAAKVILAYAYNRTEILDLDQYPQPVRGSVWQGAIEYECKPSVLYAETSIV